MRYPYLEVTFRRGKPFVAYLYLPRSRRAKAVRTVEEADGILVDYAKDGTPMGLEITAPARADTTSVNRVLRRIGASPVRPKELAPLHAA